MIINSFVGCGMKKNRNIDRDLHSHLVQLVNDNSVAPTQESHSGLTDDE